MIGLREHIIWSDIYGMIFVIPEISKIPAEGNGIAGDIAEISWFNQ